VKLPLSITKRALLSPYVLFWGVAFTYFWIAMGAFVMSAEVPKAVATYYTVAWFGTVMLLSSSRFNVSTSDVLSFQTGRVSELLSSSLVVGENPFAILTLDVGGFEVSLVKGDRGVKLDTVGALERLYALATGGRA
jgi:hypothetical protein